MTTTTMVLPEFCPSCLDELPDGYPFDHVAIDRALAGDSAIFGRMAADERRETITVGRRRGMTDSAIAVAINRSLEQVHRIMGEATRTSTGPKPKHDALVLKYWQHGLSDHQIAFRLGIARSTVGRTRARQGLAPHYTPAHQREVAA